MLAVILTVVIKTSGDPDFKSSDLQLSNKSLENKFFKKKKTSLLDYNRSEEQTILTIPEWYLVYNPKEYADFLAKDNNPSDFPFMKSINEYWVLYDRATIVSKVYGVDNDEYIFMLNVIGTSTTAEYMFKGLYENTLGRLTRWSANNQDTSEDQIIKAAHRAYSNEIYDDVWYVFNFKKWVSKIWEETDFFGNNFIRKTERKIFFTLEFGFKHIYAKLIAYGAESTEEQESSGLIYMEAILPENTTLPNKLSIVEKTNDRILISSPRWGGFTESIPVMLEKGVKLINVSGNDVIAVSYLLKSSDMHQQYQGATFLFNSDIVTDSSLTREISLVKVKQLHHFLSQLKENSASLEHIYDY
jgi:hypothetical protein